jgi:glutamate-1-semialdehyde 2,1-aminomutase
MLDQARSSALDQSLQERARRVVPNGVYGHQSARRLPDGYPQFFARGAGSRVWDVDGNEYVDYICAYGPVVLGHRHAAVEAAVARQEAHGEVFNGPTEQWVALAELLVETIAHADWVWFAKNGGDATTYAVTVARAATGRAKLLRARGAYHGATPWWTPVPAGVTPADTANQLPYVYNDLESVHAAANQAGDDLAAIIVSPFKHDARFDQEDVDPEFARGLREVCDATGAALILDDVRAGFRIDLGGSWEPLGVQPDISCYSKAIANGYPLAAVGAADWLREAAERVYATGSFWFAGVPQAAAVATIETLRESDAIGQMQRVGQLLRDGLEAQAATHGLRIKQTGPVQIPFMTFSADTNFERANAFCLAAVRRGVYFHPWHNWFLSAAHTEDDIRQTLEVGDAAFGVVREQFGEG